MRYMAVSEGCSQRRVQSNAAVIWQTLISIMSHVLLSFAVGIL